MGHDDYGADVALVHHCGFGRHAANTGPGILTLLDRVRLRGGPVHEVGCGSGALTHHLVDAGHHVVASDASPAFVRLAREQLPDVDVRRIRLPDDPLPEADAVVSVGHVLNYLPNSRSVRRALFAVAGSLRPGGLLAVDLCDLDYAADKDGTEYVRVEDDWALITRFSVPRPASLVRELTTFLQEEDGRWRRSDERHATVLLDTSEVPGWLEEVGVRAEIRPAFGVETLPRGLVALVGTKGA
jgi:SAM-dependent methyltransferase